MSDPWKSAGEGAANCTVGTVPLSSGRQGVLDSLVNAYVVHFHEHGVGEDRIVDRAAPGAAHGDVEDQEELLVEGVDLVVVVRAVRLVVGRRDLIVHQELQHVVAVVPVLLPDQRVGVETLLDVVDVFAGIPVLAVAAVLAEGVQGVGDHRGVLADVLHDVDLTAAGPLVDVVVGSQHPERGPRSASFGELDAGLDLAVGEAPLVLRVDAA